MNPERRRAIRNRFERFRNLPPERREELRRRFEESRGNSDARVLNRNQQRPGAIDRSPQRPAPTRPQQPRGTRPTR